MAPQETRQVDLTLSSNTVGTSSVTVAVASPNDYVSTNNSAQVTIQITDTPKAATTTSSGTTADASSGGGGGGAIDWVFLSVLTTFTGFNLLERRRKLT